MKRILLLLLVIGLGAAGWWRFGADAEDSPAGPASYRTAPVDRGTIVAQVSTAGTVAPITTVIVGSQLSGQIVEILADYNSEVTTGQILARLNSDQIRARLDAARADLAQSRAARSVLDAQMEKARADAAKAVAVAADMRAQLEKSKTQLADAEKTLQRQTELSAHGFAAATALQTARTQRDTLLSQRDSALAQIESASAQIASLAADRKVLEAQMQSSEAAILQRAAVVRQIEVDLGNTDIRSPVNGVVIQRNVELGQPVAASLQAPTLFLVAQDLRRVQIQANVDEADVGRVRAGQPVSFTVNAYPGRDFSGTVQMVRLGSQTVQNVVIYTSVIEVENPNLELKPGMTANLRILTERKENIVRVPNGALRWRPPAAEPARTGPTGMAGREDGSPSGPFAGGSQPGRGGRGLFVERIKAELTLTEAQKTALDKLLAEMPDTGSSGGPGGGRQAREAFSEKIMAILDDAQKAKFAAMQQAGRAGGRGPGGGGGPGGGAQPPQAVVMGRVYKLENGEAVGVSIRLGASDGVYTEVLSGLQPGAQVITGGGPAAKPGAGGQRPGFRFGI